MDPYKNYCLLLTVTLTNCYKCCVKKKKNCKIEMPYVIRHGKTGQTRFDPTRLTCNPFDP